MLEAELKHKDEEEHQVLGLLNVGPVLWLLIRGGAHETCRAGTTQDRIRSHQKRTNGFVCEQDAGGKVPMLMQMQIVITMSKYLPQV